MSVAQRHLPFTDDHRASDGPRFAEFFAGIGLVRMGLERAGWRVAYANDIDPKKYAQYQAHFRDADEHFQLSDIHEVDADRIPDVQLATASFPCTDLSVAGGRRGLNTGESSAFWGFHRKLDEMGARRPPTVLLENVVGFLTSHGGDDFCEAMEALNELGYAVDPFILDARWFVPQSRPRLFVVGRQNVEESDEVEESRVRPRALVEFIRSHEDICWSISELPEPPESAPNRLKDILDRLPDHAPEWWSDERVDYLFNQMSPRHQEVARRMIAKRTWSYGTVFRRVRRLPDGSKKSMGELRTDGIAGCLRTPKGGSGRQILFKGGNGRMMARLLTPRECARLMGADDFTIEGSLNDALFGFGDAVCVNAIEWIANHGCIFQPQLTSID